MRPIAHALAIAVLAGAAAPASAEIVAYEGARLIVGNGQVIDKGTLVVDGAKILQAGADARAPAGARRVDLAGKTVMPMIIDCHVHLNTTREALERDLRQRAWWGVSAALSMGNRASYHAPRSFLVGPSALGHSAPNTLNPLRPPAIPSRPEPHHQTNKRRKLPP